MPDPGVLPEPGGGLDLLGHDADWQYPAITERHAHARLRALLPHQNEGWRDKRGAAYLGFPWATLIDLRTHAGHRADRIDALQGSLAALSRRMRGYDRVVTVCQHIRLGEFHGLLEEAGVTDVYWSHADRDRFSGDSRMALHPFPLYPVQQQPAPWSGLDADRPLLYSFVGAKASVYYPSKARNWIIEALAGDPRGRIVEREAWHFDRVVYDRQIRARAGPDDPLIDARASAEFLEIMGRSVFTLCPAGTGPNSIRLWEAVLNGSIPVVISDAYRFPGDARLWEMAALRCPETPEAVRALPGRLAALAADPAGLHTRRLALFVLAGRYGPDRFVHDILARFAPDAAEGDAEPGARARAELAGLLAGMAELRRALDASEAARAALRRSTSWRVTRPLRALRRLWPG